MRLKNVVMVLLAVLPVLSVRLAAQGMPKSFTPDNVKFIEEMRDFFETNEQSTDKKKGKDFIDDFNEQYWVTGKISEEIKQAIYKNANAMAAKKFKPSPEYYAYFNTIKYIVDKKVPMTTFNDWQVCFTNASTSKNQKPFSDFIMMGEGLFRDNTFYDEASGSWQAVGGSWKFMCDTTTMIRFTGVTLKGRGKNDSTIIYNTTGTYNLAKQSWTGTGGKVDWTRAGMKPTEVWCELKNYTIPLKTMTYSADSVTFYNKIYFKDKPLIGRLSERLTPDVSSKTAQYPRFESYSSRYQIKSMYPNVDYEGGFTQIGSKFIGSGSKEEPAFFMFKRNGKNFLYAASQSFAITSEKVTSPNTTIKFFLDADSIYHPLVDFKFFVDSSRVEIYRSNEGASSSPFTNSFHKVDMYVERMVWKTNEPTITMGTLPGTTQGEASFPSADYYRQYLYDRMQGMDMVHPLIKIRNFVYQVNDSIKTFPLVDLARYWKLPAEQLRPTIMNLSNDGFVIFDPTTDMVTYKDKSDTYIAARAGKKDYDNILFESKVRPGTPNAQLNLLNYDMTIFGVEEVGLSDSQNVTVFPKEDKIILKKNRTFTFEGSIMAGRFDYYGKLFSFDYTTFSIKLNNVDSVRIWVDTPERDPRDPKGGFKQVKVRSVIENLNGTLAIDNPANKSGVWSRKYPNYPIFNSAKPSYVYYDKPTIHGGVYNRDKFYFKLDTFTIDSLDNFTNKSLHFTGILESAGIFPTIRDTLGLQPDYSLGFVRQAPPGGYPLYGGKAKFTNTMYLSNKGLHGNGQIDYITSTSVSKDFLFFPDSTNGVAQSFVVKEQKVSGKTEYPDVTGSNVYIHWMPKADYMQATNKDSSFTCYKGEAKVDGTLTLGPKSLRANGEMDFNNAEMLSTNMVMKQHIVDADTVDFNLKAANLESMAFSTKNFKAHVDFEKREGEFKANGKGSIVNFPVNQYICYMENFKWFMDKSQLELSGNKPAPGGSKVDLNGPEFISVHPKQDSLRFFATRAKFDYLNFIIEAEEVKEIKVADAKVIPDSGKVVIERNAYMRPLENSKIDANSITLYHHLFNCHTEVFGRYSYTASGDYAYVDELKKEQIIHFSKVAPDTSGQTYAEGNIADTARFMLSPAFDFQGKVILAANNQFLVFDGTTGLQHDCAIGKKRMKFKGEINPMQIYIPVAPDLTDEEGKPITAGIISSSKVDSVHVYGAFLSPKKDRMDVTVVGADGFMFFDKASREYRISNKEKLVERSLPGNYISFSTKTCEVYGEGKMNLGSDLGQVTMLPVGNATHNTVTRETNFDLVIALDFFMSGKAMDVLLDDINASTSLAGTEATRPTFEKALNELVGQKKADKLITDLKLYGSYKKFPDELEHTFFFTDVKMTWNQATKAYVSTGKLGLGSMGKTQINKFVPGVIILERKKSGDILSIYFELDNGKWYTFRYTNGVMLVYSSNEKFNDIIKGEKDDDKKKEGEKGQKSYRYSLSGPGDRSVIVKKQKQAEAQGTEPEEPEPK